MAASVMRSQRGDAIVSIRSETTRILAGRQETQPTESPRDGANSEGRSDVDPAGPITAAWLHEQYLEPVFHYILRRVPRRDEAEDIAAEVFAAAFTGLPRFRGQCSPYLWLLGIARRQVAIALRRRTARRE